MMEPFHSDAFYVLDEAGNPLRMKDPETWIRWMCATEGFGRQLALARVGDSVISTVFLGLDRELGLGPPPPRLFETLVRGGVYDGESRRYATRAAALAGHALIVAEIVAGTRAVRHAGC
jgi:hypothetical protein